MFTEQLATQPILEVLHVSVTVKAAVTTFFPIYGNLLAL